MKLINNAMVESLRSFSSEVTRVAREVGTEGKLGGQAVVKNAEGEWQLLLTNVNHMARLVRCHPIFTTVPPDQVPCAAT
jgi:hypothetical protein